MRSRIPVKCEKCSRNSSELFYHQILVHIKSYFFFNMSKDVTVIQIVNMLKDLENKLASIGHTVPSEGKGRSILRGLRQ